MNDKMRALIAFGANLPFGASLPAQTIADAVACLDTRAVNVKACSRLFKTPCFPKGAGPDYVNAAAVLEVSADMTPFALLQHLHAVEARFGRSRNTRWGMRTLDIDLLALDSLVLPDPAGQAHWRDLSPDDQARLSPDELILPHPRLQDRAFVLVPLADIAPDWVHPILQRSVVQMLEALSAKDRAEVRVFA
ncbi:2-amino-4-hydroxy-6-hydroxymethyldihydropteridine diphosphokinase [Pseudotabrizicola sp.]|uniref:2-amino-4-hydroxy-6- hydroxymethyldihydropteridine diphosphokinase n=1 Tax=Pseudotabrizicola sp. TaxID=2939647 RepID=UPI0027240201|nr:2-amino-4-hydroxy-6-hydroxymethyldihydropteridine diphosphokinase [Pseudotabrizicola sp.]MDO8885195.1 2-amino-4-hydroxy-6-hydroxymethyldihydropteridine diphosphokinase [Pseudotabrizicola sp.]